MIGNLISNLIVWQWRIKRGHSRPTVFHSGGIWECLHHNSLSRIVINFLKKLIKYVQLSSDVIMGRGVLLSYKVLRYAVPRWKWGLKLASVLSSVCLSEIILLTRGILKSIPWIGTRKSPTFRLLIIITHSYFHWICLLWFEPACVIPIACCIIIMQAMPENGCIETHIQMSEIHSAEYCIKGSARQTKYSPSFYHRENMNRRSTVDTTICNRASYHISLSSFKNRHHIATIILREMSLNNVNC